MNSKHQPPELNARPGSRGAGLRLLTCAVLGLSSGATAQSLQVPSGFCAEIALDSAHLTSMRGLTVSDDGTLYIGDNGAQARVLALDPASGLVSTVLQGAPLFLTGDLRIGDGSALVGDDLVVSDGNTVLTGPCCDGAVLRVDRQTGSYSVIATGNPAFVLSGDPYGLALAPGGLFGAGLFVMDFQGASANPPVLYTVSQAGIASPFLIDPVLWNLDRTPGLLEFDPSGSFGGDLFVLDASQTGGAAAIWRVTPQAGLSVFVQGPLERPGGIGFGSGGAFGTDMYVLDVKPLPGTSSIVRIDPSGTLTPFVTGLPGLANPSFLPASGLTFSPDGQTLFVALLDTVFRIRADSPWTAYCTAGTSASGCNAVLSACGTASASAVTGFSLIASGVEGSKDGLYFMGTNGRQANTWGNGTSFQCVIPPVTRAGLLDGAGTNGACDGSFSKDINARWTAKPAQNPGAGAVVQAQLWYRDPFNTSNQTTSLSDAIEFTVEP